MVDPTSRSLALRLKNVFIKNVYNSPYLIIIAAVKNVYTKYLQISSKSSIDLQCFLINLEILFSRISTSMEVLLVFMTTSYV